MPMNRRQFTQSLGAALGAGAALAPRLHAAPPAPPAPAVEARPILLDNNENPYGPSPAARAAITASEAIACRYADFTEPRMIERLAAFYQLPHNQIMLGCGSTEVLCCADRAFLAGGKSAIASRPTFEVVLTLAQAMQADPVTVPETADFRHDLPAMAAAVNANTGLVYVCNPNNPTGTIVSLAELRAFLDRVPARVPVLVDEAYYDFVDDPAYGTVAPWLSRYPNLIVARTFSKVYGMAGLRLGYALGSPGMIAALRRHKLPMNANQAALAAALACFNDRAHIADQRRRMFAARNWLYAELRKDGRRYIPSQGNFVMIDLATDVEPVVAAFRRRNILVGRKFPAMGTWLRITIGTPAEMRAFMAGLRAIVPARAA